MYNDTHCTKQIFLRSYPILLLTQKAGSRPLAGNPYPEALPRILQQEAAIGRSRYKYYSHRNGPYYLTATIIQWLPLFGFPEVSEIVINSLQFLIREQRIELHGFIIMVNHLHLIASGDCLAREIGLFKSYTARQIVDWLTLHRYSGILREMQFYKKRHKKDQDYQVWEEGSHPKLITSTEMLQQKLNYIHHNQVRKNFVDDPAHWLYSSHRFYFGGECVLPVTPVH